MKLLYNIGFICFLLSSCSDTQTKKNEPDVETANESIEATISVKQEPTIENPKFGIDLFIDTMKNRSFFIDTIRLKDVGAWRKASRSSKHMEGGVAVVELPFPIDTFQNHFTNPKTYFFAQWNEEKQTFKNGTDYLLMSWDIDARGIAQEKTIYVNLIDFMGNYPCYMFRDGNRFYAMAHRQTVHAKWTKELMEEFRDMINPEFKLYGHHNRSEFVDEAED